MQIALLSIIIGIAAQILLLFGILYQLFTNALLDTSQIHAFASIAMGMGVSIIALIVAYGVVWNQQNESKKQEEILRAIYKHMFGHDYYDSSD